MHSPGTAASARARGAGGFSANESGASTSVGRDAVRECARSPLIGAPRLVHARAPMNAIPSFRSAFLLLVLTCPLARSAGAQARDETERWVPSLGITSGVIGQKAD